MSERFVIVHRTYDPIQADLLGELLRDAGVCARVTGTRSGALIGVAQNILEVHIAVPESQAGPATDFLEAFFSAEAVEGEAAEESPDGSEESPDGAEESLDGPEESPDGADGTAGTGVPSDEPRRQLRPLLAAGTAFLTFGTGHLYARRPGTAAALVAGQLVAMGFLIAGNGWHEWTFGIAALVGIVSCDVIGAIVAVRAFQRGVRRSAAWQSMIGALYVVGTLALAHVVTPHLLDPARGDPAGGWRQKQRENLSPLEQIDKPLARDPSFPPLTSEHPANPAARSRP